VSANEHLKLTSTTAPISRNSCQVHYRFPFSDTMSCYAYWAGQKKVSADILLYIECWVLLFGQLCKLNPRFTYLLRVFRIFVKFQFCAMKWYNYFILMNWFSLDFHKCITRLCWAMFEVRCVDISRRLGQWKNFQNRPVFDEVICRILGLTTLVNSSMGLPLP